MTGGNSTSTVATSYVYPSNKHKRELPPTKIPLSVLDEIQDPYQAIHYWQFHSTPGPINAVIDSLKNALAEALELYIPLTGTLYRNEDGTGWYIAMDSKKPQGTLFIFETRYEPYIEDGTGNLEPRGTTALPSGSSMFAVKVTQFSCGSVIVCGSMNHQLVDLRSYHDFINVWARLARGESIDLSSIPDDWSRTLTRFFPPHQGEPVYPFDMTATEPKSAILPQQRLETVVWKCTKGSINRLKMDISASITSKNQWISSGDALTALVFGALTRAREKANVPRATGFRSSKESQTESIFTVFDCRSRALPRGEDLQYFGNASLSCKVTVPRAELLSATTEATSRIALAIRNDMRNQLTPDAIANQLAFYEDLQAKKRPPYEAFLPMDALCTNCARYDMQIDFGWGKSYKSSTCDNFPAISGMLCIQQDEKPGDIKITLSIEADARKQLEADPLLRRYSTKKMHLSHL